MSMFHRDAPTGDVHQIHQWTYADSAAKAAASGFASSDVGKVALQIDTAAYYILTDDDPITWQLIGDGVQSDIDDAQGDIDDHIADASGAHAATAISFTPAGSIAASTVQAAIEEVATDAASALSTHEADTSTHGTTGAIVGISDTQVLTNKDIDGGTASDTSRITLAKASTGTLSGLTRKEGTIFYDTTLGAPVFDDGATLNTISSATVTAPSLQKFTSTGTTTGYVFTVTSANATVGATYTNNGNTYTVLDTIAAQTRLFCSQAAAPAASGTLTKASGTGDATITFSAATALGTYTLPTSPAPLYIRVRMVGGGASGSGGGSGAGAGSGGRPSYFGANLLTANGGSASSGGAQNGGVGGSASLGTGPVGLALSGGNGSTAVVNTQAAGGMGGATAFGGSGHATGGTATANTGAGGGGGNAGTGGAGGGGGGAGGFIDAIITSASATYPYVVGAIQSSVGSAGTGGAPGGGGAAGILEVTEYYQ